MLSEQLLSGHILEAHTTILRWVQRYAPEINTCYRSFDTAERTVQGVEAVNMIRKGQVKRLDRSDAMGQAKFVETLFEIAASA